MAGEVVDSNLVTDFDEVGGVAGEAVFGDGHQLIVAVQQIEGFDHQIDLQTFSGIQAAAEPGIGAGVVGSEEGIASGLGQTVVVVVIVLVRIAGDGDVYGAATAVGEDSGEFPVVEDVAEELLTAMKQLGLGDPGKDQALALVGNTVSTLGVGSVGILHHGGPTGDQGVLAV